MRSASPRSPGGVEHLGDDGETGGGSARCPHRVVHGELRRGQCGRVTGRCGELHGPVRGLDQRGVRLGVDAVPHDPGRRGQHPGPQDERSPGLLQDIGGLPEQVEDLGVLRPAPVAEGLHAQRGAGQRRRVVPGPAHVGGFPVALPRRVDRAGPLVRGRQLEQDRASHGVLVVEQREGTLVVGAGVVVAESGGGLAGGSQAVVERVVPHARPGPEQVGGDPRRAAGPRPGL